MINGVPHFRTLCKAQKHLTNFKKCKTMSTALTNQEHCLYQQINSRDAFQGESPCKFHIKPGKADTSTHNSALVIR